jgi:lipopolysaccharide transport system permease protein
MLPFRAVTARSEVPASFRSSSIRPGPIALVRTGIKETLSRRRLIRYLVRADLKKSGADTLLGNVWWVVDPLLQMLVYYVFVGVILDRGGIDAYPLFIFSAILPWKWFTTTVGDGVSSVTGKERLIKQIYFPKLVLPLAAAGTGVVGFAFGLVPLLLMMLAIWPNHITGFVLLIPLVAVAQFLFSMAVAIAASAANVFYRDIGNLTRHVLRFWFYLSPSLYGMDQVEKFAAKSHAISLWFQLNPFTYIFESYRDVIYYGRAPDWGALGVVSLVSLGLIALAILFFKRAEPTFAKVL